MFKSIIYSIRNLASQISLQLILFFIPDRVMIGLEEWFVMNSFTECSSLKQQNHVYSRILKSNAKYAFSDNNSVSNYLNKNNLNLFLQKKCLL